VEETERQRLMTEGFPDWSRKDFKVFTTRYVQQRYMVIQFITTMLMSTENHCHSLEEHGRYDIKSIVEDVIEKVSFFHYCFYIPRKRDQ
jgi:hypothetical protein